MKVHTNIDQLILDTKDLSYFPITRIVTEDGDKYWQVENKWDSCLPSFCGILCIRLDTRLETYGWQR
jgi:hypothetical protein